MLTALDKPDDLVKHVTYRSDDRNIHPHILRDRGGINIDMDNLGPRAKGLHFPRYPVIKANPKQLEVVAQWDLSVAAGERPALSYPCWSAPVVVGNKLLLRGTDHAICLDLTRG